MLFVFDFNSNLGDNNNSLKYHKVKLKLKIAKEKIFRNFRRKITILMIFHERKLSNV